MVDARNRPFVYAHAIWLTRSNNAQFTVTHSFHKFIFEEFCHIATKIKIIQLQMFQRQIIVPFSYGQIVAIGKTDS